MFKNYKISCYIFNYLILFPDKFKWTKKGKFFICISFKLDYIINIFFMFIGMLFIVVLSICFLKFSKISII